MTRAMTGLVALCLALSGEAVPRQEKKKKPDPVPKGGAAARKAPPPPSLGPYVTRRQKSSRLVKEGGDKETEKAVAAALDWLVKTQRSGGGWHSPTELSLSEEHGTGITALAVLAFAGAGITHASSDKPTHARSIDRAVTHLLGGQSAGGRFPGSFSSRGEHWIYDHGIATLALAELYILSGDAARLREPLTAAVRFILEAQNPGRGWRYGVKAGDNDTSVTTWMVQALFAASHCGLDIPATDFEAAYQGALTWYEFTTAPGGRCGYFATGDDGSRLNIEEYKQFFPFDKKFVSSMTGASLYGRLLLGASRTETLVLNSTGYLAKYPPQWRPPEGKTLSTNSFYYWYLGSNALFQMGGDEWKTWNRFLKETLLKSQKGPKEAGAGSWDPVDEWGLAGGRVYATTLAALALETYYRHQRIKEK